VAKLREHRLGDLSGAIVAARRAAGLADRRRRFGFVDPAFDRALTARLVRLAKRNGSDGVAGMAAPQSPARSAAG
jgi:hypothetical protein